MVMKVITIIVVLILIISIVGARASDGVPSPTRKTSAVGK